MINSALLTRLCFFSNQKFLTGSTTAPEERLFSRSVWLSPTETLSRIRSTDSVSVMILELPATGLGSIADLARRKRGKNGFFQTRSEALRFAKKDFPCDRDSPPITRCASARFRRKKVSGFSRSPQKRNGARFGGPCSTTTIERSVIPPVMGLHPHLGLCLKKSPIPISPRTSSGNGFFLLETALLQILDHLM